MKVLGDCAIVPSVRIADVDPGVTPGLSADGFKSSFGGISTWRSTDLAGCPDVVLGDASSETDTDHGGAGGWEGGGDG